MRLGIFTRTFIRPTLGQVLAAVRGHGFSVAQFNLTSAGLETLPDSLGPEVCRPIREAFSRDGLEMAAVSGTFNAIHPDPLKRRDGIDRCKRLIGSCRDLGAPLVSLCSGTRDSGDMWRAHPENSTAGAWTDLIQTLSELLATAEAHGVTLGIEPETANVIASARAARRLLDELGSPRVKIILDAANLFGPGEPRSMQAVLEEAFDLLGADIVIAHAKELGDHGPSRALSPPGSGLLDWAAYFRLLRGLGRDLPLIVHGLTEAQVPAAIAFIKPHLS